MQNPLGTGGKPHTIKHQEGHRDSPALHQELNSLFHPKGGGVNREPGVNGFQHIQSIVEDSEYDVRADQDKKLPKPVQHSKKVAI